MQKHLRRPALYAAGAVVVSLFLLLCLTRYGTADYLATETERADAIPFRIASLLVEPFGAGAFLGTGLLLAWSVIFYFKESVGAVLPRVVGMATLVPSFCAMTSLGSEPHEFWAGSVGIWAGNVLYQGFGPVLGWTMVGILFMVSLALATDMGFHRHFSELRNTLSMPLLAPEENAVAVLDEEPPVGERESWVVDDSAPEAGSLPAGTADLRVVDRDAHLESIRFRVSAGETVSDAEQALLEAAGDERPAPTATSAGAPVGGPTLTGDAAHFFDSFNAAGPSDEDAAPPVAAAPEPIVAAEPVPDSHCRVIALDDIRVAVTETEEVVEERAPAPTFSSALPPLRSVERSHTRFSTVEFMPPSDELADGPVVARPVSHASLPAFADAPPALELAPLPSSLAEPSAPSAVPAPAEMDSESSFLSESGWVVEDEVFALSPSSREELPVLEEEPEAVVAVEPVVADVEPVVAAEPVVADIEPVVAVEPVVADVEPVAAMESVQEIVSEAELPQVVAEEPAPAPVETLDAVAEMESAVAVDAVDAVVAAEPEPQPEPQPAAEQVGVFEDDTLTDMEKAVLAALASMDAPPAFLAPVEEPTPAPVEEAPVAVETPLPLETPSIAAAEPLSLEEAPAEPVAAEEPVALSHAAPVAEEPVVDEEPVDLDLPGDETAEIQPGESPAPSFEAAPSFDEVIERPVLTADDEMMDAPVDAEEAAPSLPSSPVAEEEEIFGTAAAPVPAALRATEMDDDTNEVLARLFGDPVVRSESVETTSPSLAASHFEIEPETPVLAAPVESHEASFEDVEFVPAVTPVDLEVEVFIASGEPEAAAEAAPQEDAAAGAAGEVKAEANDWLESAVEALHASGVVLAPEPAAEEEVAAAPAVEAEPVAETEAAVFEAEAPAVVEAEAAVIEAEAPAVVEAEAPAVVEAEAPAAVEAEAPASTPIEIHDAVEAITLSLRDLFGDEIEEETPASVAPVEETEVATDAPDASGTLFPLEPLAEAPTDDEPAAPKQRRRRNRKPAAEAVPSLPVLDASPAAVAETTDAANTSSEESSDELTPPVEIETVASSVSADEPSLDDDKVDRIVERFRIDAESAAEPEGGTVDASPATPVVATPSQPARTKTPAPSTTEARSGTQDALFAEAVDAVRERGRGSVVVLQRRLGIGFTRATRIIEELMAAEILGPENESGSHPLL